MDENVVSIHVWEQRPLGKTGHPLNGHTSIVILHNTGKANIPMI